MYHVFNMGIGMVAVVEPARVATFQTAIPEKTWVIGRLVERAARNSMTTVQLSAV